MDYVALSCRLTIAETFLVAVALKARNRRALAAFVSALREQAVVPERYARAVALITLAAEVAVVGLVVAPPTATIGLGAAAVLGAFVVAIVAALRRGTRAPCNCFGSGGTSLGSAHVARNLALIGVCAAGLLGAPSGPLQAGGVVVAAARAAIATLIVAVFDDLVDALRRPSWAS